MAGSINGAEHGVCGLHAIGFHRFMESGTPRSTAPPPAPQRWSWRHSAVHGAAASSATLELQLQLELELELALMFTPAVTGTANSSMIP